MAHNRFQNAIDTINRQGYERFFNFILEPLSTYRFYQIKYQNSYPTARYLWGLLWRTVLMISGIIPAIYASSRLLQVALSPLAWMKSFNKAAISLLFSSVLTLVVTAFAVRGKADFMGLGMAVAQGLTTVTAAHFPLAVGFLVWGSVMQAALIFFMTKMLTQGTAFWASKQAYTSFKHDICYDNYDRAKPRLPQPVKDLQLSILKCQTHLKSMLVSEPEELSGATGPNKIRVAETAIRDGKHMVDSLEEMMLEQRVGSVVNRDKANTFLTSLPLWKDKMGSLNALLKVDTVSIEENLSKIEYSESAGKFALRVGVN